MDKAKIESIRGKLMNQIDRNVDANDYDKAYYYVREAEKIGIQLNPEMVNAIKSKVNSQ